ncbi:MAG: hypothetical protein JO022_05055, partial [Acidobacteriaceae bacterium]|nr:hypothetical protein [Acidobacteriaceae bacterium]
MLFVVACAFPAGAQTSVLTAGYSNLRTNANMQEAILTPANIDVTTFGKLGEFAVDGNIYGQPLYVSGLNFPQLGAINTLFVATMHNSVYAINADDQSTSIPLWRVNLGRSVPSSVFNCYDVYPEVGVLSTPAIDRTSEVIYVVSATLENGLPSYRLHALSLLDGHEMFNGPALITGSVAGTASDAVNGVVAFDPFQHLQRPGLLVANRRVYVGFGSHGDLDPWHGWLFAYSANDLSQSPAVFNATPNGGGGSFWQAGRGLAEAGGLIYAGSANGDYDGHTNVANSFLQLSPTLKVLDWYTPDDWQMLSDHDNDVASGGSALLPGSDLLIGGDKFGTLYLMHQHAMANLVQTFTVAEQSGIFNFAVWPVSSGPLLYIQVQGDVLRSYSLANGQLNEQPFAMSNVYSDIPYQGIAVSSNGADGGVVWLTSGDHSQS